MAREHYEVPTLFQSSCLPSPVLLDSPSPRLPVLVCERIESLPCARRPECLTEEEVARRDQLQRRTRQVRSSSVAPEPFVPITSPGTNGPRES